MRKHSFRDIAQTFMLAVASANLGLSVGSVLLAVMGALAFIALHFVELHLGPYKYRKSVVYAVLGVAAVVWVLSPEYEYGLNLTCVPGDDLLK